MTSDLVFHHLIERSFVRTSMGELLSGQGTVAQDDENI